MTGRLRFDEFAGRTWEESRGPLDRAFRSLLEVLDRGWRWGEQTTTIETVIDTGVLPVSIEAPNTKAVPTAVLLVRATVQRSTDASVISGAPITWAWRGGRILISAVGTLAASTRYDVTLAVME